MQKPNLKSLNKNALKDYLKKLRASRSSRQRPPPSFLAFPKPPSVNKTKTGGDKNANKRPGVVSNNNAVIDARMDANRQVYRNYVQRLINTGLLNPSEPSFRNDMVEDMKSLQKNRPNLTRMNTSDWFVNNLVSKARMTSNLAARRSNVKPVKITSNPPMTKTRQLLLQRRKGQVRSKKPRASTARPARVNSNSNSNKSATTNSNRSNSNRNINNNVFNMNKANKSNNNSSSNSNSNNGYASNKSNKAPSATKKPTTTVVSAMKPTSSRASAANKRGRRPSPAGAFKPMSNSQIAQLQQNLKTLSASMHVVRGSTMGKKARA